MIHGGNVTVFVRDFEQAVRFYTETLGLKLEYRAGNEWASVNAGDGFRIGLHAASASGPSPGTLGALQIGLNVAEPMEAVVNRLTGLGVDFDGPIHEDGSVRLAFFRDPDGQVLYLCEVRRS